MLMFIIIIMIFTSPDMTTVLVDYSTHMKCCIIRITVCRGRSRLQCGKIARKLLQDDVDQAERKTGRATTLNNLAQNLRSAFISEI